MNAPSAPSPAPSKGPLAVLILVVVALAAWGVSLLLDGGHTPTQPTGPTDVAASRPESVPTKTESIMTLAPVRSAATPDAIEGVVRDAFGNPLSDVTIQIIRWDFEQGSTKPVDQWATEVVVATSTSDKDGRYGFTGLPPGEKVQAMRALKPGFISQFKDTIPTGRQVDFAMMSGVPLSGRVVDVDTGQPIAGVRVKGWFATGKVTSDAPTQFRWNENVYTDKDGRYAYEGVPDKNVQFLFHHVDYEDANEFREIPSGKPNVQEFKLKRGLVIEGVVRNRRDSKPLANVVVKGTDAIVPRYHATTGADGVFRITGIKRGRLRFSLETKGYSAPPDVRELTDAEQSTPERPNRLEFFMEPSGAVAGIVTLPDGSPAAGARVWLARNAMLTNSVLPKTETGADAQGRFLLRDLDVGQKYAVVAIHRDAALGTSPDIVCGPGEIKEDFTFKLPRGGVISGKVVDDAGVPVVGAVVTLERPAYSLAWFVPPSDVGQAGALAETTGPDGTYAFRGLWAGQYTLRFDEADHVSVTAQTVQLRDAEDVQTLDATLSRAKAITGRVLTPDGQGAAGALVEAWASSKDDPVASAVAGPDGTFKLSKMLPGWYRLKGTMTRPRLASKPIDEVAADTSGIEIRLLPLGEVTGFVVDASGAPVKQFSVSLDPIIPTVRQPDRKAPTGGLSGVATEFEDEAGFFRVKDLEPGTYGILVSSGNFAPTTGPQVTVDGSTSDVGAIRLKSGAVVAGKLTTPKGQPTPGVLVFLDRIDPPVPGAARREAPPSLQARNDAAGEWRLAGVAAGQYQLRYESDQWVCPANAFITVSEGETLTRNEVVKPAASLTTIAVDQFGEPIPALDVTIFDEAGARVNTKADTPTQKTDLNGRVNLSRIPAERVKIRFVRPGYKVTFVEDVVLTPGERTERRAMVEKLP